MRILLTSPTFGAFGGMEAVVFKLAAELRNRNVDVIVCLKKVKGFRRHQTLDEIALSSGVRVVYAEKGFKELFPLIRWADLVHANNLSIDVALLSRLLGKPLAITIHNRKGERFSFHRLSWSLARHLADRCWYISNFVWNSWEPVRKKKTSSKISVISNLPEGIIPVGERKGFVFVSRWIANKGLEVLLEAYARVDIDREAWPLILVGDGPRIIPNNTGYANIKEQVLLFAEDLRSGKVFGASLVEKYNRDFSYRVLARQWKEALGLN